MQTSSEFLDEIEAYLKKHEIAPTTFGKLLMGDGNFVEDLRNGRQPLLETCVKISKVISHPQSAHMFYRGYKR